MPPWLKQVWIDWLGPERIFELYAGTEGQLRDRHHRHRMARPPGFRRPAPIGGVEICDPDGHRTPGRPRRARSGCAPSPRTRPIATSEPRPGPVPGGWESLGDMGRLDDEGYLYLGDRIQDMILRVGRTSIRLRSKQRCPSTRASSRCGDRTSRRGTGQPSTPLWRRRTARYPKKSSWLSSRNGWPGTRCPAPSSTRASQCGTRPERSGAPPCAANEWVGSCPSRVGAAKRTPWGARRAPVLRQP